MAQGARLSHRRRLGASTIFENWANLCCDLGAVQQSLGGAYLHVYPRMPRGGNFNNLLVPRPRPANLAAQIAKAAGIFRLHGVPGAVYLDATATFPKGLTSSAERLVPRPTQALMLLRAPARLARGVRGATIRRVRASELEEYAQLIVSSFEWEPPVLQPFHEVLRRIHRRPHFRFLVALHDDRLVGSTILHLDASLASVNEVATLPEFRGRGIATALVSAAVNLAVKTKLRDVWLRCVQGSPAQRLYKRLGFDVVTLLKAFRLE